MPLSLPASPTLILIFVDEVLIVEDVEAPEPAEQYVGEPATPVEADGVCELDCEPRLAVPSPTAPSPLVPRPANPVFDVPAEEEADAVEDVIVVVLGATVGLTLEEFVLGGIVTPEVVVIAMLSVFTALHGLDALLSAPSEFPELIDPTLIPPPSNVGSEEFTELAEQGGEFAIAAEPLVVLD
jgi:hypothetical protein